MLSVFCLLVAIVACAGTASPPSTATSPPAPSSSTTVVVLTDAQAVGNAYASVSNETTRASSVYVSFGADSVVQPADWTSFCKETSARNCTFTIEPSAIRHLPTAGRYLNATITFGAPVGCGATKAELNINNPKWYDIVDVSLVDGYSNDIAIKTVDDSGRHTLGPPKGAKGNEKVYGLYPYGCDICVARQHPPCGIQPGSDGCKSGTQYKPDVPCQYQGPTMGGGTAVQVSLVALPVPR